MKIILVIFLAIYALYEGFKAFISVAQIAAIKNEPYSSVFDRMISLNGECNMIAKKVINSVFRILATIGCIILI